MNEFGDSVDLDSGASTLATQRADRERARVDSAFLTVEDVAALLACSRRHVYRLRDSGLLPAPAKLGALVRWSRHAIETWIRGGCPRVESRGMRAGR